MKDSRTWAIFAVSNDGDDVVGIFTHDPTEPEIHEVVLALPMFVYSRVYVLSYGPKTRIPNHRTKAGRMKDAGTFHEEHG